MKNNIKIFGIKISARTMNETVDWIKTKINSKKGGIIYCATMNEIQMCENSPLIKKMFEKADLITADGMPLVWGIRYRTGGGERVYGPDLMSRLIYNNKNRHIFVGNEKNKNYFKNIGSYVAMPMKERFTEGDYKKLFEKIKKMSGEIVWLGLGAKKQIEVAYELKKRGINKIIITVGAAFDFLSGNKKQAPRWLRMIGGEWLFRLISEPRRLNQRYLTIIKFLGKKILKKICQLKYFGGYLFLSILLILPQFFVRSPGLVDDGTDILFVKKNGFLRIVVDRLFIDERTRVISFIYRKLIFEIFGLEMIGHFMFGAIILAISCFLLYKILKKITLSNIFSFWGTIFFLISPTVSANYYRLGTDEPIQLLFVLMLIFAFMKKKTLLMFLLLILNLFVKETSVFFLILSLVYFFITKKKKLFFVNLFLLVFYGCLVFYKYRLQESIYIHRVGISWSRIMDNFQFQSEYFIACLLIASSIFVGTIKGWVNRQGGVLVGGMILAGILPMMVWDMQQEYYYLILLGLVIISFGYVINQFPKKLKILLEIIFVCLGIKMCLKTIPVMRFWHREYVTSGALSKYLINGDFKNTKIYSSVIALEKNHKIYVYSNEWSIPSISFIPTMSSWIMTFPNIDDSERVKLSVESLNEFMASKDKNRMLISDKKLEDMKEYNLEKICGQTPFLTETCEYYIYRPLK